MDRRSSYTMTNRKLHSNPITLINLPTTRITHKMLITPMTSGFQIDLLRFASNAKSLSISSTESIIAGYVAIFSAQSARLSERFNHLVCLKA